MAGRKNCSGSGKNGPGLLRFQGLSRFIRHVKALTRTWRNYSRWHNHITREQS